MLIYWTGVPARRNNRYSSPYVEMENLIYIMIVSSIEVNNALCLVRAWGGKFRVSGHTR